MSPPVWLLPHFRSYVRGAPAAIAAAHKVLTIPLLTTLNTMVRTDASSAPCAA